MHEGEIKPYACAKCGISVIGLNKAVRLVKIRKMDIATEQLAAQRRKEAQQAVKRNCNKHAQRILPREKVRTGSSVLPQHRF